MRILVACEESQAVTIELRRLGHEAYSCDLQECSGGHPEWHLQVDALELLKLKWDMIIAHPPCTYLTAASAIRLFNHECMIYQHGASRLIGTTNAAYPAEELAITTEGVATLFDWPDVQEDITVDAMMFAESQLYAPIISMEKPQELSVGFAINYLGEEIVPLCHQSGVYFIRGVYRDAAKKVDGYDRYYLSQNAEGEPIILLSDGLMMPAAIKPLPRKTAAEICNYLCRIGEMPARGWEREEGKTEEAQIKGQIGMDEMLEESGDE